MGYTVGYGGRTPQQLIDLLQTNQIKHVVDVRLRPDRASMGFYKLANDPTKGIQGLLAREGIEYHSYIELGNLFVDWGTRYREPYTTLLANSGHLLIERLRLLFSFGENISLLCAEKDPARCHRTEIVRFMNVTFHTIIYHL